MSRGGRAGRPAEAYVFARERWRARAGEAVLNAATQAVRWAIRRLPLWTAEALLAPLGALVARAVPGFRRRAADNLARVWPARPQAERDRLLRAAGAHMMRLIVEYAQLDRIARSRPIDTAGIEHLHAAQAAGRGTVIVTAHIGNWETVRIAARAAGVDCGLIYRAFNNRYFDRFVQGLLAGIGEPVLHKGPAGLRGLLGHLRRGGTVMILVDQRSSGAPRLPFLGQPAETALAAAEIARRCGAALIPAVGLRDVAGRRFAVRFEPPVTEPEPLAAMAEVNARISAWIEAEPAQWFWFHRRWKSNRAAGG